MNEDIAACYWLYQQCQKAVCIHTPLYFYRKNSKGVTNCRFTEKKLDLLYVWDLIEADVNEHFPEYAYVCSMNHKRAYFTLLCHMKLHGYDKSDPRLRATETELKQKVRSYRSELLCWKMPLSRKMLLLLVSL